MWADLGGTAIPGQAVTEVEQAPSTPSFPKNQFNPLNAELNPMCHLLTLVGAHHILHVSKVKANILVRQCRTY